MIATERFCMIIIAQMAAALDIAYLQAGLRTIEHWKEGIARGGAISCPGLFFGQNQFPEGNSIQRLLLKLAVLCINNFGPQFAEFYYHFNEAGHEMMTFLPNDERDQYGVYSLADQLSLVQVKCAFALVLEGSSDEILNLAAKTIEGVAFNAMITFGGTNLTMFVDPRAVILHGPIFNIRTDTPVSNGVMICV